jgi:hypothetical protein
MGNVMKDIPDEIEKMEQIAENLDDWAKKESHNIAISNLDYYISAAKTMEGFNVVLEWLRYKNKPHEAEKLHDEAAELLGFAEIVGQKDSNLKIDESFCFRDLAQAQAIVLSKHLRHIAEMARKELPTEKAAETEQNATPVKPERESWWLKLYEKTLKVIVDAVMERWWPKQ